MTLNNNLTKQLMHKKLAADLTSLAHSILQMKNKEDVFALKTKAHEVYEKLAVLAFVEEYINNTPNPDHSKEELVAMVKNATDLIDKELPNNATEQTLQEEVIDSSESIEQVVENDSSLIEEIVSNEQIDETTNDHPIKKSFDLETDNLFSQTEDDLEPEIKENTDTVNIPIIALTANAMAEHRQEALDGGFDEFETKPVRLPTLIEKIENFT